MSILSTSPSSIRVFDVNIANALGCSHAATILQQLHYWMQKKGVGVIVDGVKYVYNTFRQWIKEQFLYLTESKFINAMNILRSLEIVKVNRCKATNWNQTNHYSLDYQKLKEWAKARNIEISELADNLSQDNKSQPLKMNDCNTSLYEPKNTYKKEQQSKTPEVHENKISEPSAAAKFELASEEKDGLNEAEAIASSIASPAENKQHESIDRTSKKESKSPVKVDSIVNFNWKSQLRDLDDAGIPVSQTLIRLIKSYRNEEVESAIALVKTRKKEQHIPNPAGYFVSALKENWAGESGINSDLDDGDLASVFRYWYDLAKQLGYCSGQEIREGEQWVCLSGSWEKWSSAVERGYSIDYLKKILKRNGGRS